MMPGCIHNGAVARQHPFRLRTLTATLCILLLANSDLALFCFDYPAITGNGEWWRLLTAHLVHSSRSHLFWDLCAFAGASWYLERTQPSLLLPSWGAGLVTVNMLLLSPLSGLTYYCGLSGLLFAPLVIALWLFQRTVGGLRGYLPLLITATKLGWELISAEHLVVQSDWAAYPEAHLAGAIGGILLIILIQRRGT